MNFLKKIYKFIQSWTGTLVVVLLVMFFFIQGFTIPTGSMKNTLLVGDFLFVKKFSYGIPTPHLPWVEIPLLPDFNKNGHLISSEGPKRGDIVVFRYPNEPRIHYVKRCVAKGGDEVVVANKTLYVRMVEGDEYMKDFYPNKTKIINGKMYVKEPYIKKGIHYDSRVDIESTFFKYLQLGQFAMKPMSFKELGPNNIYGYNAYYFKVPENEYFMMGDNRDHSSDSRFWGSVEYKYIVGQPWFIYFSLDENKKVRWERIGRLIDTLENDEKYIHHSPSDIDALE
ncbi:signal peptidase I [Campylobacter volucris]|uniref:Signal peptidase I n=1 Tax=Campylobacter volucris TaxID=1031542 RepID=A0AAE5YIV1_9BACT|nr:signal peptidase I [Campylobacter volucris]AJC93847.1 leader peptidase (signal peptidase I) [Campylobacter volucris LMG 24379]KAB0579136.1 signal peptidase I [Campylobacter volucris]MBF7043633.1 signal peptidase I [Campylobacter volucris]MBF7048520.1 signal peptidase I [Campylobacter volucris]MBF7059914.1 signal peptidase I [Campylobacter volucris]